MIDRDNGGPRAAARRDAPADFMAVLGGDDNRYTTADGTPAGCRRVKKHLHGNLGGIPIVESDVLILDRGASGGDGFGVAGLVVPVARSGVFGGDGEASRVVGDLEAVAAVGAVDRNLIGGIDGRPYPGRGDDVSLRGVGGPGRGDYFAPYGGSVEFGELYHRYGVVSLFGADADCNGCVSCFLHCEGECAGVLFHLEGETAVGAGFYHLFRGGGGGDFRIRHLDSG